MVANTKRQRFKRMAADSRFFMQEMWRYHDLERWAPLEAVDYDICHWLQHGPDRSVTLAFRGQGKTYKTDCYVIWNIWSRWYQDDRIWTILCSASELVAKQSLHLIRGWVRDTPWLQSLEPKKGSKERDGARELDLGGNSAKNPTIAAVGITGQLPSRRAHLIVPDDVETNETALTVEQRQRLRLRIKEFENIILAGGKIQYLMTPQHVETIALDLTKKMGYTARSWPARMPDKREQESILGLAPWLEHQRDTGNIPVGSPTCPERFTHEELMKREAKGRTNWLMQWQLHVGDGELITYPLRLSDLIVYPVGKTKAPVTIQWGKRTSNGSTAVTDISSVGLGDDCFYGPIFVDEKWEPYHCTKMFVDPSGRGKDETAWCIIGQLYGNLFVKRVAAYRGGHYTENLDKLAKDAFDYHVNDIVVETNFGGDMIMQLIQPRLAKYFCKPGEKEDYPNGWSCYVTGIHHTTMKEARIIDTIEPNANQHRIIVDPAVAQDQQLWVQYTQISRVRGCLESDDRVDCFAGTVEQFKDVLDQDNTSGREQTDQERINQLVAEARQPVLSSPNTRTSWIHI